MDIVAMIAEQKIREAIQNGEFADLSGKGRPLEFDDLSGVPEDCRASYIILKNNGLLTPEMELKKEIVSLQKLLNCCYEDEERKRLSGRLNEKMLRFNIMMEKRGASSAMSLYGDKIYEKLRD